MQDVTAIQLWLEEYLSIGAEGGWLLAVFSIIFLTLLCALFAKLFFNRLALQLQKTKNQWDDILLAAIRRPIIFMIWLLGGSLAVYAGNFVVSDAASASSSALLALVQPVRKVGAILLFAWFFIRFIRLAEVRLIDPAGISTSMDHTTVSAFAKLLRLSIIITVSLVVLQSLGYSISGVLAFGGIGGIAVGFAAKDLLANFFGGLMIYMDRPFKVGDWIRSPDKNIEGVVEDIGWRLTRIRTFDKRPLYVPNATFASISVENPSRMSNRRIYETVGVRYCDIDTLSIILVDVRQMLEQHPEIDTKQTLMVNFNKMAESSLDFFVYTFTKTTNWEHFHKVKEDVLFKVAKIIQQHNAQVAFPTSTLHLEMEDQPRMPSLAASEK
ncbi:MAG: mechanosensitive ion channel family protein [Pseudomonadales bacterium]|nr:mechanosensitive ion channel family protein [Pseudomonadales bacterium]NRA14183.1 mechanosensitive ion channel family protein [Oceanospirillaceae bacterium]